MPQRIAVFGGSFNPPGLHHRLVAEALVGHFDRIIVVPCGPRPDKLTTNDVETVYRAALADIAFRDLPRVEVDLFDLGRPSTRLPTSWTSVTPTWARFTTSSART